MRRPVRLTEDRDSNASAYVRKDIRPYTQKSLILQGTGGRPTGRQNGFTTTRITIITIRMVGISLRIR